MHVVKTCRDIWDDVEPRGMPAIPRGTYGIAPTGTGTDYVPVDFGAPWGVQLIGNHDLLDAQAVLGNARRAIVYLKRPWRVIIRRTLKGFAGPYLKIAACSYAGEFAAESHLRGKTRRDALKLIDAAIALSEQKPDPKIKRCGKCRVPLTSPHGCDFCPAGLA